MTYEEFVAARLAALVRYAAVLTGDREQAGDIVQNVLARAYAKWPRICRAERPEAYVHRMVTNEFLNTRRRRGPRLVELTREVLSGRHAPTVPDHADRLGERGELWQRLQELPPRQRAVIVLRYYEGFSDAEIADALGCGASTVRGYASRALAALRVDVVATAGPPAARSTAAGRTAPGGSAADTITDTRTGDQG